VPASSLSSNSPFDDAADTIKFSDGSQRQFIYSGAEITGFLESSTGETFKREARHSQNGLDYYSWKGDKGHNWEGNLATRNDIDHLSSMSTMVELAPFQNGRERPYPAYVDFDKKEKIAE